jgi:hypothetical protein
MLVLVDHEELDGGSRRSRLQVVDDFAGRARAEAHDAHAALVALLGLDHARGDLTHEESLSHDDRGRQTLLVAELVHHPSEDRIATAAPVVHPRHRLVVTGIAERLLVRVPDERHVGERTRQQRLGVGLGRAQDFALEDSPRGGVGSLVNLLPLDPHTVLDHSLGLRDQARDVREIGLAQSPLAIVQQLAPVLYE